MKIIKNAIKCKKCGAMLESKSVHDFKQCPCGTFVDGGHDYLRRGGKIENIEDLSIVEEEDVEK